MKKILFVILLLMFSFSSPTWVSGQEINQPTFSDYSIVLNNEVYPAVKSYIQSFQFQPPSQEKSQELMQGVEDIINEFEDERKLPCIFPHKIAVLKLENEMALVYLLEVKLDLIDFDESINGIIVTSVAFTKRFVISTLVKENPGVEV